jgi:hypothetical protein
MNIVLYAFKAIDTTFGRFANMKGSLQITIFVVFNIALYFICSFICYDWSFLGKLSALRIGDRFLLIFVWLLINILFQVPPLIVDGRTKLKEGSEDND